MIFFLRFFFLFLWGIIGLSLLSIIALFSPRNPNNISFTNRIFYPIGMKILGIDFEFRGEEIFDRALPAVIVSNHQNNFDIFPSGSIIPKRTVTLGKKSILWIPLFGQYYWLSGNIVIDRSNRKKAVASMKQVAQEIRDQQKSVWIMPEGTRSRGRDILLPFKKGAFRTAIDAQVPIVPICFSSYHNRMRWNKWKAGKILGQVLEPIWTQALGSEDVQQLQQDVYSKMRRKIEELNAEIYS